MREKIFRAWDKKLNVMWQGIELKKLLSYLFFQNCPNATAYVEIKNHFEDILWLQSTGLRDRLENNIFDGDILRFLIDGKEYNEELYSVSYSEERACWQINCIKECNHKDSPYYIAFHLTQTMAACFEVAGNVFENPELFED